jgi:predicted dehydrogenase
MSERKRTTRRDFMKGSAAAAAGAGLLGGLSLARSAHAQGSDVIKVALSGCGGRGTGAVAQQMKADKGVRLIAVADAFEYRATGSAQRIRDQYPDRVDVPPERVFVGPKAYEQAIAAGPDMMVLATPPGFRPMQYAAAIEAGMHVFMEKPCCVDGPGFRMLMKANELADQKKLCVGVGLQRRHQPEYMETVARIHDGAIGDVMFTRVYWNGGGIWNRSREELAKKLGQEPTEMQYQVNNWYHFAWLSGDNICEQHIHNIDISNWVKDAHPIEANGMGGCQRRYEGDARGTGQIFDHHFVEFTYPDGSKMYSQCRHMKGCWNAVTEAAHGTKGSSNCSGRIEGENDWKFDGQRVSGHQQEQTDLLATLRAGKCYNEGYYGATSSMTAVLGLNANYSGKIVKWDDLVNKGKTEMPENLAWDAPAPVQKLSDGTYPIPMPGLYDLFA